MGVQVQVREHGRGKATVTVQHGLASKGKDLEAWPYD